PRLAELLACLALERRRAHPRPVLAARFWPDLPEAQARRYLNTHLWRLNRALRSAKSPPYLLADKQTVQLNPDGALWLDATEFDRAATQALSPSLTTEVIPQLESAVRLYRGDFMPGYYSEWCLRERERLHEQYLIMLETLARLYRARQDWDSAQAWLRRLLEADPLREAAHAQLIELLLRTGRRAQAQAHYQRYAALCRAELNLEPSANLTALLQTGEPESAPVIAEPDLAAEKAHLGELRRLWQEASLQSGPQREAVGAQLAECAGRLGYAFKEQDANAQAREHLELAVETLAALSPTPERIAQELAFRKALDPLYDLRAEREKQSRNLQRLADLVDRTGDPSARCDLLVRRAWLALQLEQYAESIAHADELLELCRRLGKDREQEGSLALRLLGIAYDQIGDFTAALNAYQAALALDENRCDALGLYYGLNNVGSVLNNLGRYSAALEHLRRAQALTPADAPPYRRATVSGNIGIVLAKLGQLSAAADCLREAMSQVWRSGDRARECWLGAKLADLYLRRGEAERALLTARHYAHLAAELGTAWNRALVADLLALIHLELGDETTALSWADEATQVSRTYGLWRYQLRGHLRRAQALLRLLQFEAAYETAQAALRLFREREQPLEERPELFFTLAECAHRVAATAVSAEAHRQAHTALQEIADGIVEAEWRAGFLRSWPTCTLCCAEQARPDRPNHRAH
ncbi:MAG: BTAD domain-containing putative transcriptional regulator, partial [Anaerolineales bacterium]|nr:BTAD domain-containing putative transcriptional regulator [Anaerolineales bacterium]